MLTEKKNMITFELHLFHLVLHIAEYVAVMWFVH